MKKTFSLLMTLVLIFGLAACSRPRQRDSSQPSTPAPASAVNPSPTPLPVADPTQVSTPTQVVPDAAPDEAAAVATASIELEQTLNELEQLLNNMDTNVEVP